MESQNFDFYIFGKNGETDLHNKSDEKTNLQEFASNSHDKSQITVYRKDSLVYYVYVKRLSKTEDYFGICLKFNEIYCTDVKKFFELFEEGIKTHLEKKEKILKSDLKGNTIFVTDNFFRNKVEIEKLEKFFRNKIQEDFQNNFPQLDSSFEQGDAIPQPGSLQDEPNDIIERIKKYNYVILTLNGDGYSRIQLKVVEKFTEYKKNHKWPNLVLGLVFVVLLIFLIYGLIQESFTICHVLGLEIPLVLFCYLWFYEEFTKGKNELLLALFTFIVSLLGLALTIDNSVFSQSDGNYGNIIKRSFKKENIIDISSSLNQWDSIPNLVFVLDMSGSTKKREYGNREEAKEIFEDVCIKLSGDTVNVKDVLNRLLLNDKINNHFTEYAVYKLRILNIIAREQENYKNKIHIVCFAGQVKLRKNVDSKTIINFITNLESNKEFIKCNQTDFLQMIKLLTGLDNAKNSKKSSQAPKYSFLFFTDYLHDVGEILTPKKKKEITQEITTEINTFYTKQNFSNYFFTSSFPRTNSDKEIHILPIFKELANEDSKAHFPKIEDDDYDFMDILPKEIIPIYYENSYPIYPLTTKITFNNIKEKIVNISLRSNFGNNTDYHHQITVLEKGNIPVFSSKPITISKDDTLKLSFSGRIINNYSSTLLTFQSSKHSFIRFDIVFFKDLPGFVRYIIACTIFSLYLFLFSVGFYFKNK